MMEAQRDSVTLENALEILGIRRQIARDDGYPSRLDTLWRRKFECVPDRARYFLNLAVAVWGLDDLDRVVGRRRFRVRGVEQMLQDKAEAAGAPLAADEYGQDLVGDRFVFHEAVPGKVREAERIHPMGFGLDGQAGVADQPDKRRYNHELEQGEIVNLGD